MVLGIYLFSIIVCILGCICVNDLTARQAKEYKMTRSENNEPISLLIIEAISSLLLMFCPAINTICALIILYCVSIEEVREGLIDRQLDRNYHR